MALGAHEGRSKYRFTTDDFCDLQIAKAPPAAAPDERHRARGLRWPSGNLPEAPITISRRRPRSPTRVDIALDYDDRHSAGCTSGSSPDRHADQPKDSAMVLKQRSSLLSLLVAAPWLAACASTPHPPTTGAQGNRAAQSGESPERRSGQVGPGRRLGEQSLPKFVRPPRRTPTGRRSPFISSATSRISRAIGSSSPS